MKRFKDTNKNQLAMFPLNLDDLIAKNHLVRVVDEFVNNIRLETLLKGFSKEGKPPYEPRTMLKVIIYSYATKLYSSRKIERALKQDVTYMWLSGMQTPEHNTINRFRSTYFAKILEDVFTEMLDYLMVNNYIKFETYFTDGTKIEANANKYSYVWASNTSRYKEALKARISNLLKEIEDLNTQEDLQFAEFDKEKVQINSQSLKEQAQKLSDQLEEKTEVKKKRTIKSKINKLNKSAEKLSKYEQQEKLLGKRNSYSKTDVDATFMRMKNDELKPGYNVQISTEDQFVCNYSLSQNASDTTAYVEHFTKMQERGEEYLPKINVADSAYGSLQNYELIANHSIENYLKYQSFYRDTKGGNKNPYHKDHFVYDADRDIYICPQAKELVFEKEEQKTTATGFVLTLRRYRANDCSECKFKKQCTKSELRTVQRIEDFEKYKKEAYENLTSEKGVKLRKQRNTDVESVFGHIKENRGFRRFMLRGLKKVSTEFGYLCIAHNLLKIQAIKVG